MRNRSRTEIVSQILEVASRSRDVGGDDDNNNDYPVTKTRIMYDVSFSYTQLKGYLEMLTDNGLLSYDLDSQTFKITEKGQRFLQIYNETGTAMKEQE
ncbi:MAG: winged helix-turn-helix domain-containing protein [Thermoproteota archaeon]|nr:winged helix-turn-helix domain-containing protein [Thermoproteota archaeon]